MDIKKIAVNEAEALRVRQFQQDSFQKKTNASTKESGNSEEESVRISALARDLGSLDIKAEEETVRPDKVAEMKAKYANGFKLDSKELAKKMIDELGL
ncbi:MAG: flagellar biosynthesis anti-sigma factor FlgM [bacterium]|nr:flagellar biosynthesis anti-sigma factor FlgM [bacterium]